MGGPSFFSLLVIAVAFMPVFTLEAQEGRLFKPLAFTKNFSMAIAALAGDYTQSRNAAALHSRETVQFSSKMAGSDCKRDSRWKNPQRRKASDQPAIDETV